MWEVGNGFSNSTVLGELQFMSQGLKGTYGTVFGVFSSDILGLIYKSFLSELQSLRNTRLQIFLYGFPYLIVMGVISI